MEQSKKKLKKKEFEDTQARLVSVIERLERPKTEPWQFILTADPVFVIIKNLDFMDVYMLAETEPAIGHYFVKHNLWKHYAEFKLEDIEKYKKLVRECLQYTEKGNKFYEDRLTEQDQKARGINYRRLLLAYYSSRKFDNTLDLSFFTKQDPKNRCGSLDYKKRAIIRD